MMTDGQNIGKIDYNDLQEVAECCENAIIYEGSELRDSVCAMTDFIDSSAYHSCPELQLEVAKIAVAECVHYLSGLEHGEWGDYYDYYAVDQDTYEYFGFTYLTEEEWCKKNGKEYKEPPTKMTKLYNSLTDKEKQELYEEFVSDDWAS